MATEEAKSTARRDLLVAIEKKAQERWEVEKPFEASPKPGQEKYFITFPYPYMNGRLHLGHGFSFSKSEFAARYMRLKGRNVLWPFGLHVTGTPIAACAQKLTNEIAKYGNPPVFPEEVLEGTAKKADAGGDADAAAAKAGKHTGKRSKIGPAKPQWKIMEGMGIPKEDIPKFADARHWLNHFPPLALQDLKRFGAHVDYRRSFITTDVNPFYDSFVRWQFDNLQKKNLLAFGKRYCIYSPLDGQPCADHDRASGEGVQPVEYCVVRLHVQNPSEWPSLKAHAVHFTGKPVVLPGATLRAETVVGLTNCWVSPTVTYKAYEVTPEGQKPEIWLMTQKSARNLAFQNVAVNGAVNKDPSPLFEVAGESMIGMPLASYYGPHKTVYTLPMSSITESKGTGVVMSVPSDSPDDWINLQQFLKKPDYRAKLNIKDEWVVGYDPIPILTIPGELGENCAEVCCKVCKVGGPKDRDALDEAKKMAYQAAFYQGTMTTGPFSGQKVSDAKVAMAKMMVEKAEALTYYEPMKQVMSRSGDECVVALTDQWFLRYGEEEWKKQIDAHLPTMQMYFSGIRNGFKETLEWLSEWPCSRNFGLGTQLESRMGDAKVIIDSLSDSTIYMAYYTVAHYFHETSDGTLNLDGNKPNKYGITPAMVKGNDFWDFVFRNKGTAADLHAATGLPIEVAEKMRAEFSYFYPVDLRVSGKDLIQNHLTMFLYNHAAIWPDAPEKWPRAIYCNGHIMVDGEKMSKSAGNFVMLTDAFEAYTTDGTRMALADAGDSMDDANFVRENATGFIMKLTNFIEFCKNKSAKKAEMRTGEKNMFDRIFENAVNACITKCDDFYSKMCFRQVLNAAFFELQSEHSQYELYCGAAGVHQDVEDFFLRSVTVILSPLCPHVAEHVWTEALGNTTSVMFETFPVARASEDMGLSMAGKLIQDVSHEVRTQAQKLAKKRPVDEAVVYVAPSYAPWQAAAVEALAKEFKEGETGAACFPEGVVKTIVSRKESWVDPKAMQDIMAFMAFMRGNAEKYGKQALTSKPPMDDMAVLSAAQAYMGSNTGVAKVEVKPASDDSEPSHKATREKARPGQPVVAFPPAPAAEKSAPKVAPKKDHADPAQA